MENFQDRGVWIRIRSLKNAWIQIRFVLKGRIRILSISDRIRNPGHGFRKNQLINQVEVCRKYPKKLSFPKAIFLERQRARRLVYTIVNSPSVIKQNNCGVRNKIVNIYLTDSPNVEILEGGSLPQDIYFFHSKGIIGNHSLFYFKAVFSAKFKNAYNIQILWEGKQSILRLVCI